jgi:hypothetical protein
MNVDAYFHEDVFTRPIGANLRVFHGSFGATLLVTSHTCSIPRDGEIFGE